MKRLRPLIVLWKKMGQKMGEVFSFVVLFFAYFLCLCPWALVTRLFGKKWATFSAIHANSNWIEKGDDRWEKTRYERMF